jgi:hypothetical protein
MDLNLETENCRNYSDQVAEISTPNTGPISTTLTFLYSDRVYVVVRGNVNDRVITRNGVIEKKDDEPLDEQFIVPVGEFAMAYECKALNSQQAFIEVIEELKTRGFSVAK